MGIGQLALRISVSPTSVITPGAGCSITSAAMVSTTEATGCFTFRATFLSALGQKRTFHDVPLMSALPPKADMLSVIGMPVDRL